MTVQTIRVIRELADTGTRNAAKPHSYYCPDLEAGICSGWEPNTDIVESEEHVLIRMEMPGITRQDISIRLKNGNLLIMGNRKDSKSSKNLFFHQLEINYGPFAKIIALPEDIEHNDISAALSEGFLDIKISKKSQVIEIPISVHVESKRDGNA